MGDSPPVLITTFATESSLYRTAMVPWIEEDGSYAVHPRERAMTLYDTIDTRLLFADFFARLHLHGH
jgi:hypothetical protein